jgi:hypothetical protein
MVYVRPLAALAALIGAGIGCSVPRHQTGISNLVRPPVALNSISGKLCNLGDWDRPSSQTSKLCQAGTTRCAGTARPIFVPLEGFD